MTTVLKPQTGRCSALQQTDIDEYSDSVTAYISKCSNDAIPNVNVRTLQPKALSK